MHLSRLFWSAISLVGLTYAASAQQEPFGENIGGWTFTQGPGPNRVTCRAFSPGPGTGNIIGRTGNGGFYVSVSSQGIPKGKYEGSDIAIAGQHEPVNSHSDGSRYVTPVDDDQIGRMIKARGYAWRAMVGRQAYSGVVMFDNMIGPAVTRLRECTKANGGR